MASTQPLPITIYSKPGCVQCVATKRYCDTNKISYRIIDMTEDEGALNFVKGMGYQQAPVLVVPFDSPVMPGEHWSGFNVLKLDELKSKVLALT